VIAGFHALRELTVKDANRPKDTSCSLPNLRQLETLNFFLRLDNVDQAMKYMKGWNHLKRFGQLQGFDFRSEVIVPEEQNQLPYRVSCCIPPLFLLPPQVGLHLTRFY